MASIGISGLVRFTQENEGQTIGSKVILPSGENLPCVTDAVIRGSAEEGFWMARIECMASVEELSAIAEIDLPEVTRQVQIDLLEDILKDGGIGRDSIRSRLQDLTTGAEFRPAYPMSEPLARWKIGD